MASANIYLNYPGTAEAAFNFYKSVLGGEIAMLQRFKESPDTAGKVPDKDKDKIMHIAMPIGNGNMLMATDALESMGHPLTVGNHFHIALSPESEAEAKKLFDGLSAGGKIVMPLSKASWGALFGMFTDKFGVQWMVNYMPLPAK